MSTITRNIAAPRPAPALSILYVGTDHVSLNKALAASGRAYELYTADAVADALAIARAGEYGCVIVDASAEQDQTSLLAASLAGLATVKSCIVIAAPRHTEQFSLLQGVSCVIPAPAASRTIADAIFSAGDTINPPARGLRPAVRRIASVFKNLAVRFDLSALLMPVISFLYKHLALVLLGSLFALFIFYGILISFFLISTGWAAPITLSRGSAVVVKIEQQLGDMRLRNNQVQQQINETRQEKQKADRAHRRAGVMANLVSDTLDREISLRQRQRAESLKVVKRLAEVEAGIVRISRKSGMQRRLDAVFKNRLISKKAYDSSILALLDMAHKLASVRTDVAAERFKAEKTGAAIVLLKSLKQQILSPDVRPVAAGTSDLIPLAAQVMQVKTSLSEARARIIAVAKRRKLLLSSRTILDRRIATILKTPLGRAISQPVVVLFVPYDHSRHFTPGEPLYGCALTIAWCRKVGKLGAVIPGETSFVHPFFAKNMRGFFIEALLSDPEAAKKEVLHVGRPPILF